MSDSSGAFSLTLPDGTYRLAANAPGFAAAVADGVVVSGASVRDLTLTASGQKLTPVPVFGGQGVVAADGSPGVFYFAGGNVGGMYRSVDWGGTWTQATGASDDPANGLSNLASPARVVTSGFPGEVAVSLGGGAGVFYSTDYGLTWHEVANSSVHSPNPFPILWGHAGSRSVMVMLTGTDTYVADMTAASPAFVAMTAPYAPAGQPVAVGDGAGQPWLATVDSTGNLSVYPLIAQTTAPAPALTLSGFPANAVAVGIGGASASGVPPAGVVVASTNSVTMTLKAPADATYPAPPAAQSISCKAAPGQAASAHVTPNTSGSYGAAWFDGCWLQDAGGTLTTAGPPSTGFGNTAAIDAGYDATNSSDGTDAVVLLSGGGGRGNQKLAATQAGFPVVLTNQTTDAKPGTDPTSAGVAVSGITASAVHQTTFGPAGEAQVASAMDVGGVASDDGGTSFHLATYAVPDSLWSVAWWQGASGNWLLYGRQGNSAIDLLTGFPNWTSSTPPVVGGNVDGSSATALGISALAASVQSLAGVPGQDTVFLDLAAIGGPNNGAGYLFRASLNSGPSFSSVAPIGGSVIAKPGPLAYCPSAGSASTLQDVLLVIAQDSAGGTLYRVTGATTASPTVTKVSDLPGTGMFPGRPGLHVDCGSGTVIAASGGAGDGLLKSTDGGQSFSKLSVAPNDAIRAIALTPGAPNSMLVGTAGGFIYGTADGGQTWAVENDPSTGVNLGGANASGGIWDIVTPPATTGASADLRSATPFATRALTAGADLVAGPGEFQGRLAAPPPVAVAPSISSFSLTNSRFVVGPQATAISAAAASAVKTGTTFRYTLSAASTATILIQRQSIGRIVGNTCAAQTKSNARNKTCTLYISAGTLTRNAKQGNNTLAFSGRIGKTALAAGDYRATITARIGIGPISNSRSATFTVLAAPSITSFSLTNRRFAVGPKPTAIRARAAKVKTGTTFRYTLSAASTATVLIERQVPGVRKGKSCVALGKRKPSAHAKRCTAYARSGVLTRKAKQGNNTLAFSGRIGHKALAPASYRATITAQIGAGPVSNPRAATFTIVKG